MRRRAGVSKTLLACLAGGLLLLSGTLCLARAAGNGQTLSEVLQAAGPNDPIPVIVTLADRVNPAVITGPSKQARRGRIVQALQARASLTQGPVLALLRDSGATRVQPLWIINGVAATVAPALAQALMGFPGVQSVTLDATLQASAMNLGSAPGGNISAPESVIEWNVMAVRAPTVWNLGLNGTGVVVANMDTGVDYNHPDVQGSFRGGTDSWWDPWTGSTVPYDAIGHGTQTMGLMVGGSAGGTSIGVAPGAKWIAAKIYDDFGNTTVSRIHMAFQWLLAPSGVAGAPDAPDVVDASWGLAIGCNTTFQPDLDALRASGIVVVFAAGNSGPNGSTSVSPANNVGGYSAGAVDNTNTIADFSSRGPSACTGGTFPDTVAPGVAVKTSDISFAGIPQYAYASGTSFSSAHVAGAAALLAGAFPAAAVTDIERALRDTARDLGPVGPDNTYGSGLVDVFAAYESIAGLTPLVIQTNALPGATLGVAYSQTLKANGGIGPYTWSVTAGSLPDGLGLSASTGSITGTPTPATPGTFDFTVEVLDAVGTTAAKALSISVAVPLVIVTASLPGGTVGAAYNQTLQASGGVAPYTWSMAGGSLPPGLSLAGSGSISGTPMTPGAFGFTVQARDSVGTAATGSLSIGVVAPPPPPLVILTSSLPGATVGVFYSQTLQSNWGVPPYAWSVNVGSLPLGLSLTASTGVIKGTPAAPGAPGFTVQVRDAAATTAAQPLSISVVVAPLAVTTKSLKPVRVGRFFSQTLAATGGLKPYTWSLASGPLPPGLVLSVSGRISGTPTTAGTYPFVAQVTDKQATAATKLLSITIQ